MFLGLDINEHIFVLLLGFGFDSCVFFMLVNPVDSNMAVIHFSFGSHQFEKLLLSSLVGRILITGSSFFKDSADLR